MARVKMVNGVEVPLSPAEEAALNAEEAIWAAKEPVHTAAAARIVADETERQQAKLDANLMALLDMTPAQISNAIDNAFLDPAQRVILKRLARIALSSARRVLR
jgi:hypothetical protein